MSKLVLFTPKDVKNALEERENEDFRRASALKDITKQLLDENARAEKEFASALDNQNARWAAEEEKHRRKIITMQKEINDLKEERERQLIPIVINEEDLHNREEALAVSTGELADMEASLEEEGRALMLRIDQVAERESAVKQQLQRQKMQQEGIDAQRLDIERGAKTLSKQIQDFELRKRELDYELSKREAFIEGKMTILTEREKQLEKREKAAEDALLRVEDQRTALARVAEELNRKKHG